MTTEIKVKQMVAYGGHSINANGSVNLTLKGKYSELTNTVKLLQLLNNDVNIKAKLPGSKPKKLGIFRIKDVRVDGDGESIIKMNGLNDYIEVDELNNLITSDEFAVMYEGEIEEEESAEEEAE